MDEEPERLGAGIGGFVGAAVVDIVLRVGSKEAYRWSQGKKQRRVDETVDSLPILGRRTQLRQQER